MLFSSSLSSREWWLVGVVLFPGPQEFSYSVTWGLFGVLESSWWKSICRPVYVWRQSCCFDYDVLVFSSEEVSWCSRCSVRGSWRKSFRKHIWRRYTKVVRLRNSKLSRKNFLPIDKVKTTALLAHVIGLEWPIWPNPWMRKNYLFSRKDLSTPYKRR